MVRLTLGVSVKMWCQIGTRMGAICAPKRNIYLITQGLGTMIDVIDTMNAGEYFGALGKSSKVLEAAIPGLIKKAKAFEEINRLFEIDLLQR